MRRFDDGTLVLLTGFPGQIQAGEVKKFLLDFEVQLQKGLGQDGQASVVFIHQSVRA